jgi:quinolinate synthase
MNDLELNRQLQAKIRELKKKNEVNILAHFYQRPEVQEIADFIGDSLELAKKIKTFPPNTKILYAAVSFMAESGKVLNPEGQIYFPIQDAECPMAIFGKPEIYKQYKEKYPEIPIVLYINSLTEAKAYADVIVTSSSALQICKRIREQTNAKKLAFGPDKNLADWVSKKTGIPMDILPPEGHCYVHNQFTIDQVKNFRQKNPNAKLIVHPECPPDVVDAADFVGSTKAMYAYIQDHSSHTIGIGTELGFIHYARARQPSTNLIPLSTQATCFTMKKFTLETIEYTLEHLEDVSLQVHIDEQLRRKVLKPLDKMIELSN